MTSPSRYDALLAAIRREFPSFRLVAKADSWPMRTLGRAWRRFRDDYHSTIGQTVYTGTEWETLSDDEKWIKLRHEREHMRQWRTWGLLYPLLYLLLPLPFGLAWCRAEFEKAAYRQTVLATAELHGPNAVNEPAFRERILQHFHSAVYGWCWPFRWLNERWYDAVTGEAYLAQAAA